MKKSRQFVDSFREINSIYAELTGCLCPRALLKNLSSTIAFPLTDKIFISNILKNCKVKP